MSKFSEKYGIQSGGGPIRSKAVAGAAAAVPDSKCACAFGEVQKMRFVRQ